jgi:RNA polymerase sigma-70 factor (ECF subfamily)
MSGYGEAMLSNCLLLEEMLNGSAIAAVQFHSRYSARIRRWVWRLLGPDGDHDDVVQQIYINILESAKKIRNPDTLDTWVDSVAIKTVRYEIRKRKVRRLFWGTAPLPPDNADNCRDTNSAFKESYIKKCYKILDSMPADDRIVLSLRFLEGYSVERIAAIGKYSISTAKRRLSKA